MNHISISGRSKKNWRVLAFVIMFYKETGATPTIREIMRGADIKSTSHTFYILNQLAEDGFLTVIRRGKRRTFVPNIQPAWLSSYIDQSMRSRLREILREMKVLEEEND